MTVEPLGGQRVRMLHRSDDADGGFTVTATEVVAGCSVQPERPSESYDTGQQARQVWRVFGPLALAALRSWDAVDLEIVPGSGVWTTATLTGPPQSWPDELGAPHHVELTVTRLAG